MVVIPEGNYLMGSNQKIKRLTNSPWEESNAKMAEKNEAPQHLVQIKSFAIGKYLITEEQWANVMGGSANPFIGSASWPKDEITWDEAQTFITKLNHKTGKSYRLPSESEWEYSARAGTTSLYHWGDNLEHVDDYVILSLYQRNQSVGLKKSNQFGLYDMIGHRWQWTQDCWNENYVGSPTNGSAWIDGNCYSRVVRGSSYGYGQIDEFKIFYRSSSRLPMNKDKRDALFSFRVARDL